MDPKLKILRDAVRQNQLEANERTTRIYNAKSTTKLLSRSRTVFGFLIQ